MKDSQLVDLAVSSPGLASTHKEHLLTIKAPVATLVEDKHDSLQATLEGDAQPNVVLATALKNRFSQQVHSLQEILSAAQAGTVHGVRITVPGKGTSASSLVGSGLSAIDLASQLKRSLPAAVRASSATQETGLLGGVMMALHFPSDVIVNIELLADNDISATKVEIKIDGHQTKTELEYSPDEQQAACAHFAEVLDGKAPCRFTPDDLASALAVARAVLKSIETGETVDVPAAAAAAAETAHPEAGHTKGALEIASAASAAGNQYGMQYRTYDQRSIAVRPTVAETYRLNHTKQTYDFVCSMHEHFCRFNTRQLGVWESMEYLNTIVDDSDPDTAMPQIQHLLQTAEAARKAYPEEDWLHLTALIHDLGKVLVHEDFGSQPQWAVVGDTFPTGCAPDEAVIFHEYFAENPDTHDERFNSRLGVYKENCGLRNVKMSWGHDEYLYQVLTHNGCTLPPAGLFIIRYHSFYALHQGGAYGHLLDDQDRAMLPWLKRFQKCDLYSKTVEAMDVEQLKPYYMDLIHKYFPNYTLSW